MPSSPGSINVGYTDHGNLNGLGDDDHTQYPYFTTGTGTPVGAVTPQRVGHIYIDTSGENAWIATNTTNADWEQIDAAGGGGGGPSVSTGAGAPGTPPSAEGDIYIDTTNDVSYMAVGTASSSDWKQTSNLPQGITSVSDDTTPQLGGDLDAQSNSITAITDLEINESADHTTTPAAGKGIIWVKSDAPSSLMYTNDDGDDLNLSEEVFFMPFTMPSGTGTQTEQCITAFPYDGTITKIEMCHNKTTSANATNYWTILPRNRGAAGTGTTSLLSSAWSGATEAITSGVVEDLGTLANTSVTAGEMVDIVWTANGTPANYFGSWASLKITMLRAT